MAVTVITVYDLEAEAERRPGWLLVGIGDDGTRREE